MDRESQDHLQDSKGERPQAVVVKLKNCYYYYYLKYMSQDGKRQTGRPKLLLLLLLRRQGHRDIQQAKAGLWHLRADGDYFTART
jgi:hypothetical protein